MNTYVFERPLIIEYPEWQNVRQKTIYGGITLGFWAIWCYMCSPLLSALAWLFGMDLAYQHMVYLGGFQGCLGVFVNYLGIITIMGGSLLLWAFYNYYRFHGNNRRLARPIISIDDLSSSFKVDASRLKKWQAHKMLTVYHDANGRIIGIRTPTKEWVRKNSEMDILDNGLQDLISIV